MVMPRKKKSNHAVQCKPVGGELCKESRDAKKQPVRVARKCSKCGDMRCRVHCLCARRGVSRAMKKAKVEPSRTVKVAKPKQDERSNPVVLPLVQVSKEPRFPVEVLPSWVPLPLGQRFEGGRSGEVDGFSGQLVL